ncbi:MAG: DUF512 domain-containing protein [Eubacteriaceae bacterium]|nr:DUF512 domain-containing protein [Eubacteriaceae bacterium]
MKKIISDVESGSLGEKAGLRAGMAVCSLNGKENFDILDWLYCEGDKKIELVCEGEGETFDIMIENDYSAPLGISFESAVIDKTKLCANKCIFCFLDQMPKGLRESLYVRDDDYRLSFLYGNYITLTNVSDTQLERIIEMKLSPLYISVHTTNPSLREKMMKNPKSGRIMEQLRKLREGGIEFNLQFVLCPGINDGQELIYSMNDMMELVGSIKSLSCVPVGLTGLRETLYPLSGFSEKQAGDVIDIMSYYGLKARKIDSEVCFCASDEFYFLAGRDIPTEIYYKDYLQFENGVGMARSFEDSAEEFLRDNPDLNLEKANYCLITGVLGKKALGGIVERINSVCSCKLELMAVKNDFFGGNVTASGLVCGCDIIKQVKESLKGRTVFIPENMLKEDEDIFLDGLTLGELEEALGAKLIVTPSDGYGFLSKVKEIYPDD